MLELNVCSKMKTLANTGSPVIQSGLLFLDLIKVLHPSFPERKKINKSWSS